MDRLNHLNYAWIPLGILAISTCFALGAGIGALLNRGRR